MSERRKPFILVTETEFAFDWQGLLIEVETDKFLAEPPATILNLYNGYMRIKNVCSKCPLMRDCRPVVTFSKGFFSSQLRVRGNKIEDPACVLATRGLE